MTSADGTVVRTVKIVDHGSNAKRWTLVILSEGYKTDELPKFALDSEAFANKLFATRPFTEMWCAINIYRVDVSSTDSGADEPATCGDGSTGSGVTARTYFDATYCVASTARLLAGNQPLALVTASAAVAEVDATVVIVNSSRYGGAGGSVAWFSTHPDAGEIGVHEMGHAAFGLLDEYGDITNTWPGGEPSEPNVTSITDRATTKWASRIAAATALPTLSNPNCSAENAAASTVPTGTVGLFENAGRAHCGLFRAEYQCRMRSLGQPFCVVCRDAITRRLAPHLPEASGPTVGVQFRGSVPASSAVRWFTYDWSACWHVLWTVVPTSPVNPTSGTHTTVRIERSSRERLTYWIEVENLTEKPVDIEGRYAVIARV